VPSKQEDVWHKMFRRNDRRKMAKAAQAALDTQSKREAGGEEAARHPNGSLYRHSVTLDTLRPGECGTIRKLLGSTQGRLRLLEMGMTVGTHVKVLRVAAFGGPLDVLLRGYQLSLRRDEAACIWLDDEDVPVD
jgi:ferrous iron transport protein A